MKYKILPHCAIVLSGMYLVFYCIDRVNQPMAFIDNEITKALLLILSAVSVFNAISLIHVDRVRYRQLRTPPRRASYPASRRPQSAWDASARPASRSTRETGYTRPRPTRRDDYSSYR